VLGTITIHIEPSHQNPEGIFGGEMRYILYGAGGVGGVIGGRLYQHGYKVIFIARGEHLTAIQKNGLLLRTPDGDHTLPIEAVEHPSKIQFRENDVVFFTMKSQDSEVAQRDLYTAGGSYIPVVCAQNGVENERIAARRFEHVYGMFVWLPATFLDPGIVRNEASPLGGVLNLGLYPQGVDHLAEQIADDLRESSFSSQTDPDIMRWKYAKLLRNLRNALHAICGLHEPVDSIFEILHAEALACYQAAGIDFKPDDELQDYIQSQAQIVEIEGSPRMGSSSWQSLARGLPSIETDYLNGEIVLLGSIHGIATPANRVVQRLADQISRQRGKPGSIRADELKRQIELQTTISHIS
jgi:2-dehydropantoate 2-reductase